MNGNTITVVGNITREPELRYTANGAASVRLGVASSRRWQDKSGGEWQEATSFFDVVVWREMAENVAQSLTKGSRVVVVGRLEQRTYEKDGQQRTAWDLVADEVAPSLRWATAAVARVERAQSGQAAPPPRAEGALAAVPAGGEPF